MSRKVDTMDEEEFENLIDDPSLRIWTSWLDEIRAGADRLDRVGLHKRAGDYGKARVQVSVSDDGDVSLAIFPDPNERSFMPGVTFANVGIGGGRSPLTRRALHALAIAVMLDNEQHPIPDA